MTQTVQCIDIGPNIAIRPPLHRPLKSRSEPCVTPWFCVRITSESVPCLPAPSMQIIVICWARLINRVPIDPVQHGGSALVQHGTAVPLCTYTNDTSLLLSLLLVLTTRTIKLSEWFLLSSPRISPHTAQFCWVCVWPEYYFLVELVCL